MKNTILAGAVPVLSGYMYIYIIIRVMNIPTHRGLIAFSSRNEQPPGGCSEGV
jgi:hypothetical protein